ncbi:MAG: hypothetical protein AAF652_03680 [Cyanobacteria bacterium P01_C01_bin.72]
MFPNLLQATKEYWRQLDELEIAYQQGEIHLEEVDARVADLIAELAAERRAAFSYFWHGCPYWVKTQKETVISLVILALITYAWMLTSLTY